MNTKDYGNSAVDFNLLLKPYLKNWKWFMLSSIIALVLGYLKIRYSTPQYAIQAKIQILDEKSTASELNPFKDLQVFTGIKNSSIQDEIEVLSSRSNVLSVVKELGLNKSITALGNIKDTEIYGKSPININFQSPDSIVYKTKTAFFVTITSDTSFEVFEEEDEPSKTYSFGKIIPSPAGDIVITPNAISLKPYHGKSYEIAITPISMVAEIYQEAISFTSGEEYSNIIYISLDDAVIQRGRDVINALVANYNKNALEDKKAIADRTSNFIDDRIADIYGSLSSVDQSAEDFKAGRGIADIAAQTSVNLNIGASNQQELQNASVQLDIATSMKDIVDNQEAYELLPTNIGLDDGTIANTTARYNELALERKRLLESSNEKNPIILNLDQQLDGLKRSMQSSLNSMTNNLELQVNSLSQQLSRINSRIYSAPKNERALRDISRQQQTTESLYLYLLQKREESQITFASASPKSKIIDDAYLVSDIPVAPRRSVTFLISLLLGLLIPFSIIYSRDLFDNKIHNKANLEKLTGDVPVLAELPKISKKEETLIKTDERTVLAESLRILRTNLDYVLKSKMGGKDNVGKTIFITSSVPGEGKTLVSFNLSMICANANKKVLLIGADIRNPKIYNFYQGKNVDKLLKSTQNKDNLGLTDFISDEDIETKDVISSILVNNQSIDIIFSGKIPPNPTELLMSERVNDLFREVKQKYDYIIVDTAPLMVVSDTLLISGNANQTLYVTRAGVTETSVVQFPIQLQKEGKLKGLSFIVNGVKSSNLGYGGKYGYGYGKPEKKWWKF